jgi:hypothetical protein
MTKTIELKDDDFAFIMESQAPFTDDLHHTIKIFAGEEQIGLCSDVSIHVPKDGKPKIEITFIGSDLDEVDKLVLSKHLKDRVNKYAELLRKIPGTIIHS